MIVLSRFGKFHNVNTPCSDITSDTILDYVLWLKQQETVNEISINTRLCGIRTILYYAMKKGYLRPFKIKLIKAVKKIKPVYTEEELEKLLKKPDIKKTNFKEFRTWTIINYVLATANRLETVSKLAIGDIDFENHKIVLLHTKNKIQYFIPLSHDLSQVLSEYLAYRKGNKEDILFCDSYGRPLRERKIQEDIQEYNLARGVKKTSIHVIRHTFAQLWIQNGGDIFQLQEILGHSSLEMVKEYLRMFGNGLQEGFNARNPLDCFNRKRKQKGERIQMRA
jgi:integrase/recombinase XerD